MLRHDIRTAYHGNDLQYTPYYSYITGRIKYIQNRTCSHFVIIPTDSS